jgi:GT2 family glycosyltransferase
MHKKKISIIVPVIAINDYIRESVPKMLELDWPDFEIIIFTDDKDEKHKWPKTRIIPSGKVGPAEKRDLAIKYATGEILAFLDDDAYPAKDWIKKSIHCFDDKKVAAVGGPAITPEHDGVLQKVSGAVFESYLGGGATRNRYMCIGEHCLCDDWPTVNLFVRKDVFEKVGGFDNTYWPGEDTKLCLDILNAGYLIKYDPEAVVFHHRRSDLLKHFKQIGNYALHRGHFVKIYPKTSLKLFYFVPSAFVLYLIALIIACIIWPQFSMYFLIPLAVYCLLLIADAVIVSIRWRNFLVGLLVIPMIFLTHIWYGIRFIWGLIIKKLDR